MADGDALLEAIRCEPDDDTVRLIYADWLDDNGDPDRAEFIRVQIEAERHPTGSAEHDRLTDRAVELLGEHGGSWSRGYESLLSADAGLSPRKPHYATEHGIGLQELWFRRGFVEEVSFEPEGFFALAPSDIQPAGPLPSFRLSAHNRYEPPYGALEEYVGRLASAPLLHRCRGVCIACWELVELH